MPTPFEEWCKGKGYQWVSYPLDPPVIARVQVDETASAEDTASTILIFDDDDKVQERVIKALNKAFFAPASATRGVQSSQQNLMTLFIAMAEAAGKSDRGTEALRVLFQNVFRKTVQEAVEATKQGVIDAAVAKEIAKHMKALDTYYRKARAVPKGPRK